MPDQPTFSAINPSTGQSIASYRESTRADVDAAAGVAQAAFTTDLPPFWQTDLLDTVADRIVDLGDPLLEIAEAESALPRPRLTGERARTTSQLKLFAAHVRQGAWLDAVIDTADPSRKPAAKPDLRRMNIPRGPVAVFGASNFPLAFGTIGGDTASAMAAGNPVIVKGHPSHPGTSALVASAVMAALDHLHLPKGLFSLLQGTSHDLSAYLVQHPAITAVGFTGSQRAGRALFDLAAARPRPIPVFAEMGSVNPLIIMPGAIKANGDAIGKGLAGSILLGVGQFCTKPGILLVIGDDRRPLIQSLTAALTSGGTMLNENLRNNFCSNTSSIAQTPGVQTLLAGFSQNHAGITPSLFATEAATFLANPRLHEEAFGPAALMVHCPHPQDAINCLSHIEGSLTGSLHFSPDDDQKMVRQLLVALQSIAGRVIINGFPTGVEVSPAMVHGGPYPATTDPNSTSVGTAAIRRFTRMIAYQDVPDTLLPPALQNANPLHIPRTVNNQTNTGSIGQ
ncbi:MAG TPA: aldehyde dehydrogenase (NADP(+)) [Tepidisphaeraceae bacterium]|jgi:NADP-dependent aldehyde dehydrogenase|nr:aldehyde dehydrogenase (NADP(+)) [Tepidisphaeraceae bacterium]